MVPDIHLRKDLRKNSWICCMKHKLKGCLHKERVLENEEEQPKKNEEEKLKENITKDDLAKLNIDVNNIYIV